MLLHGGGIDSARFAWKHTFPTLSAEFHVYAPDWPGYGESDPPYAPPTVDYNVQVLAQFCDAPGLETVFLVGISPGGAVGPDFANKYPHRVRKLVAVDSYGPGRISQLPLHPVAIS